MTRIDRLLEPLDLGAQKRDALRELGRRQIVDVLPDLVGEDRFGLRPKYEIRRRMQASVLPSPSSGGEDEPASEHARARVDGIVENTGLTGRDAAFGLDELDLARGHEQGGSWRAS